MKRLLGFLFSWRFGAIVVCALLAAMVWMVGPMVDLGGLRPLEDVVVRVALIVLLALSVPSFVLAIKRCHDRDKSGWFVLISFIPVIGPIWLLVELGFLRGSQGENRFGPDPLTATPHAALA